MNVDQKSEQRVTCWGTPLKWFLPSPTAPIALAVVAALAFGLQPRQAQAQFIYRSYRVPVFVGPPVIPRPYFVAPVPVAPVIVAPPIYPAPVVVGPPASVRIRTPYFSMNLGPAPVAVASSSPYGYRYESYRPLPRSGAVAGSVESGRGSASFGSSVRSQYRAGVNGGIPELTGPSSANAEAFSLEALRSSAVQLQQALGSLGRDRDVWLDYLRPDLVIVAADEGTLLPQMEDVLRKFNGVVNNPDLSWLRRQPGFEQTRILLTAWIAQGDSEPAAVERGPVPAPPPQGADSNGDLESRTDSDDDASATAVGEDLPEPLPAPQIEVDNI